MMKWYSIYSNRSAIFQTPHCKGIFENSKEKDLELWKSENFSYMAGIGVKAVVNGKIAAGPNYFKTNNLTEPETPKEINQNIETVNYVFIDSSYQHNPWLTA